MDESRINYLSKKIVEGSVSSDEMKEFNEWFGTDDGLEYMLQPGTTAEDLKQRMYLKILEKSNLKVQDKVKIRLFPRVIGTAAAVFTIVLGIWFYKMVDRPQDASNISAVQMAKHPSISNKNRATLILSNGETIQLSENKSGVIIDSSTLKYNDGTEIGAGIGEKTADIIVNTPKAGSYQVTLPDGSKVLLNSASTLTFSANFNSAPQRRVVLSGEAYFEVSKNKHKPFLVKSKNQEISVLGTQFNLSAYQDDEHTKTTLIQGSIMVNRKILKPNQQAVQVDGQIVVKEVLANDALDWKNGEFICRNESLETLMKKIARRYDVEVIYRNPQLKKSTFSGSLSRYDQLTDLLKALEFAGTNKFKIIDGKIYVL